MLGFRRSSRGGDGRARSVGSDVDLAGIEGKIGTWIYDSLSGFRGTFLQRVHRVLGIYAEQRRVEGHGTRAVRAARREARYFHQSGSGALQSACEETRKGRRELVQRDYAAAWRTARS